MEVLIVEDEELAATKLERMIRRFDESYQVVAKLRSVEESTSWFTKNRCPDLVFLDIHLLDGTCFDILDEVNLECPVIFTTAYQDYVFEAFKVHSIDYLIKPVNFKKLEQSLNKFRGLHEKMSVNVDSEEYQRLMQAILSSQKNYKRRFLVKFGSKLLPIDINQIAYFLSKDRLTFLITTDDKRYPISSTLDELENALDPSLFFRINRHTIVHIQSIRQVHKYFKGRLKVDLKLKTDDEVMVSSRRAAEFQQWLG